MTVALPWRSLLTPPSRWPQVATCPRTLHGSLKRSVMSKLLRRAFFPERSDEGKLKGRPRRTKGRQRERAEGEERALKTNAKQKENITIKHLYTTQEAKRRGPRAGARAKPIMSKLRGTDLNSMRRRHSDPEILEIQQEKTSQKKIRGGQARRDRTRDLMERDRATPSLINEPPLSFHALTRHDRQQEEKLLRVIHLVVNKRSDEAAP